MATLGSPTALALAQRQQKILKSLRFNDDDTAYLSRTPSSAGNRKTWTWSAWVKLSKIPQSVGLFSARSGNQQTTIFANSGTFQLYSEDSGGTARCNIKTSGLYRDPSAWYHLVFAVDAANTDLDIYVNGEEVSQNVITAIQNVDHNINSTLGHTIGREATASNYFDGYMTEIHFVDGTALTASDFGRTDPATGAWIPRPYEGSHGTNGFYLQFLDNSDTTAATLGKDTSGNGNNWTPNNFSVPVNPSYPYALSATGGVYDRDLAFDGSTSTFAGTNTSDTITFAPSGGIAYSTSVEFYTSSGGGPGSNDQRYSFNGGAEVNCSGGEYTTVASGSGTLTSLAVRNTYGAPSRLNAIRIDGSIVLAEFGSGIDSMEDTPTNNWCTLNPLDKSSQITLSQGNLSGTGGSQGGGDTFGQAASTIGLPTTGKYLFEITRDAAGSDSNVFGIGISKCDRGGNRWPSTRGASGFVGYYSFEYGFNITHDISSNNVTYRNSGTVLNTYSSSSTSTSAVYGLAIDCDASTATFYENGTALSGALSFVHPGSDAVVAFLKSDFQFTVNFGQRGFSYPVSGFKALNTANLPVPTIKNGTDYFNTVLFSGNGSAGSVTGVGFQPDFIWAKNRTNSYGHELWDVIRGVNSTLFTQNTSAEDTTANRLVSFDSDGFSYGTQSNLYVNSTNSVAWNWKESVDAGFDIVTDVGTGAAKTVSHNLGVAPKMIIRKSRTSSTGHWYVYHYEAGASKAGILQLPNSFAASTAWNSTAPTSSVFSVGSNVDENKLNDNYISYLFAEVEGFSKFGSYTGNGSTDGPSVSCGFRPAWVMIKRTNTTADWVIYDATRSPYNVSILALYPNLSNTEGTVNPSMDFVSNGIKFRNSTSTFNASGSTYVFMAFAETPFKYANAR